VAYLMIVLYVLVMLTSVFLIGLVLIQRGKGGGLAGAFGGSGGSSAFGTKAGDIFTKITMITAGVWIALSMLLVRLSNSVSNDPFADAAGTESRGAITPGGAADADKAGTDPAASGDPAVPPLVPEPGPTGPGPADAKPVVPAPAPPPVEPKSATP